MDLFCNIIDVSSWSVDQQHAVFPVGARDKEMIWSPESFDCGCLKPAWPYLFKESISRYPDQFWMEIVAKIVSLHLKVDVPNTFPAIRRDEESVRYGALIEWFYDVKTERYLPAGQFFKRLNPDFDDKLGAQHNIEDLFILFRALRRSEPFNWLADMVVFDTLIGNTDRHQENWGIIFREQKPILSPLFDNGTSLGHERLLDKVKGWSDEDLRKYIANGYHHLRYSRARTDDRISWKSFFQIVADSDVGSKKRMRLKFNKLDLAKMLKDIKTLTMVECDVPFTQDRFEWVSRILTARSELIRDALK